MKEDCECNNWCRDGRDMYSDHHNRCPHYTAPPTDPRFARFGEAVWKYIVKTGSDFFGCEISEDILPLAAEAGLCCRVPYDPELHGEDIDAEPGDEIWWWGRQVDSTALLGLVADIRAAVGDPKGELMQDELVEHCRKLAHSEDWNRRRVHMLSRLQKHMRDPERTLVCDILANGRLLPDPHGKRYGFEATGNEHHYRSNDQTEARHD